LNKQEELFVFVEGQNDEDFFDRIIRPKVVHKRSLKIIQYAQRRPLVNKFISLCDNRAKKYVYIADIDGSRCITHKRDKVMSRLKISPKAIKVVKREIESWYIGGLSEEGTKKLKVYPYGNTESITKEELYSKWKPKNMKDAIFRLELLRYFSVEEAYNRNQSFRYFVKCMSNRFDIDILENRAS
jgi:hypothetical protein